MNTSSPNNISINYKVQGSGIPLILIHGIGASHQIWDTVIPHLIEAGFQTYAIDLLGHGESDKPRDPSEYHIDDIYTQIDGLIQRLSFDEPITIIGHSMGGYIGLKIALQRRDTLKSLILVNPFYSPDQLSIPLRAAVRRPTISTRVLNITPQWIVAPLVRLNKNVSANASNPMVNKIAGDLKRAHPNVVYITTTTSELTPELPSITQKTLVIWGENDLTLYPRSFQTLVDRLPNAYGFPIPHSGHIPHLSHSKIFSQRVIDFLNEPSPPNSNKSPS
jgi:pimeloyl-ACP methyl ester carboxylesterase